MQPRRRTVALVKLPTWAFLLAVPLLLGFGVPFVLADSFTFTTIDVPHGAATSALGVTGAGQIVGAFSDSGGLTGECEDVGNCFSDVSPYCQGDPQPPIVHAFCGPDVDNTFCIFDDFFTGYCIYNAVGNSHGFLLGSDGSSFTTIEVPGAFSTFAANGINDAGQIVGGFRDASGGHGFLRNTDGSFIPITVPGAIEPGTNASGINATGQIVGGFSDASASHGFLRDTDGSFIPITVPGAISTGAFGINATGQVVGVFFDASGGAHGFLRDTDGSFIPIDAPGGIAGSTNAYGINAIGQIVGSFQDATGVHGFLRNTDGSFTPIDVPGAIGTYASGISDAGQIVGSYSDNSGLNHGFRAMPVTSSVGVTAWSTSSRASWLGDPQPPIMQPTRACRRQPVVRFLPLKAQAKCHLCPGLEYEARS